MHPRRDRAVLIAIIFLIFLTHKLYAQSRLYPYGSRALFSMSQFPQDGLRLNSGGSYCTISHNSRDWSGRLDESLAYLLRNVEAAIDALRKDARLKTDGAVKMAEIEVLPIFITGRRFHFQLFSKYQRQQYAYQAQGTTYLTAQNGERTATNFSARTERTRYQLATGWASAIRIGSIPFGLRFEIAYQKRGKPEGELKINGVRSRELTWGWNLNLADGANLLGQSSQADGYLYRIYSFSSSWETRTIFGFSTQATKSAFLWTLRLDNAREFEFDEQSLNYFPKSSTFNHFISHTIQIQNLWDISNCQSRKLSLLTRLEYKWRGNRRSESSYQEKQPRFGAQSLCLEAGPILEIFYHRALALGGFFVSGGLSRFEKCDKIRNSEIYQAGNYSAGMPDENDNPSYGKAPYIACAIETNIEIPLKRNPALRFRTEIWQHFRCRFAEWHYGSQQLENELPVFVPSAERKIRIYDKSLGAQIGLWYIEKGYFCGIFIDVPVNTSTRLQTEIVQPDSGVIYKERATIPLNDNSSYRISILFCKKW
ncbi:hypothetical protein JXJ21_04355 [candidate division KSB1 bacterium]|nr:hypothetical protein [candidate division KSB1 bacterium]